MRFSSCFIASLCLCTAACVSHKEYTSDVKPMEEVSFSSSPTQYFTSGEWPDRNWWERFNDKQLDRCIQTAIANNLTLKSAQAKYRAAFQLALVERSFLFPTLNFDVKDTYEHLSQDVFNQKMLGSISPTYNLIDLRLNFNYEFDFWGKNRKNFEAFLGRARAAAAEEQQAFLVMSISVAKEYFALMASRVQLSLYEEILKERKTYLQIIQDRVKYDLSDELDVLRAKTAISEVQQSIEYEKANESIAIHVLNTLLGRSPDATLELITAWNPHFAKFSLPKTIGIDLLARRPDLAAQIWLVESASQEIGVARTLFYPNINLFATGGLESLHFHNLFTKHSLTGALKPALSLPIFTGGKLRANLANKLAIFEEDVYTYNQMLLDAAREVANQKTLFIRSYEVMEEQASVSDDKAKQYNLHLSRFNIGLDNYLEVIDRNVDFLNSKIQLLQDEYQYYIHNLLLIKSLGGGYHQSFKIHAEENNGG